MDNEKKNGMKKWPRLHFSDISRFYSSVVGRDNLIHRLGCEYKRGKAYRYFSNSFVEDILIILMKSQILSPENEMCIIQACQHETIRCLDGLLQWFDRHYRRWDTFYLLHFTAGLYDHVAGLLCRVEAAVLTGLSSPCASVSAVKSK